NRKRIFQNFVGDHKPLSAVGYLDQLRGRCSQKTLGGCPQTPHFADYFTEFDPLFICKSTALSVVTPFATDNEIRFFVAFSVVFSVQVISRGGSTCFVEMHLPLHCRSAIMTFSDSYELKKFFIRQDEFVPPFFSISTDKIEKRFIRTLSTPYAVFFGTFPLQTAATLGTPTN